ncbi:MAG: gfo/Idh/MocA family oxidoreductase [Spirochaetaceae bacterium]|nr:MAG: gfo/Idh/MocA family oxidoreductase [Spirochaetaceae bacterium]
MSIHKPMNVGVIGVGAISGIYLKNLTTVFSGSVTVTALSDLVPGRAESAAAEYGIPQVLSTDSLLQSDDVDIVLNLTTPQSHFEIARKAVIAGKHVYGEKPLCVTREEATELLKLADENGVRVGCSPDTVLGAGVQTCRKLIHDGWIGEPIGATAFMLNHGHESWHPDPAFYYKTGGGPMFDMGPYYLSSLVQLMGPASRISGSARKTFDTRTITSEPKYGEVVDVEVPTHVSANIEFASGAVATVITSFDVWGSTLPRIELYGTEGSMVVPNPNTFGGPVSIRRKGTKEWSEIPLTHDYAENSRGLGVADMADCIKAGTEHRANAHVAAHVLEIMHGIHDAAASGTYYTTETTCRQPDPRPLA